MEGPDHLLWMIVEYRTPGRVRIWSNWLDSGVGVGSGFGWPDDPAEAMVPGWAPFLSPSYEPPIHASHDYLAQACGWPCLSMWGAVRVIRRPQLGPAPKPTVSTVFALNLDPDKVDAPNYSRDLRLLPLHPLWPGFAINTTFYAAILWMPITPFVLRRHIRRKRGRCIKCGYDLSGAEHDACPECGALTPNPSPRGRGESRA